MVNNKKLGPISSQFINPQEKPSKYKVCWGKCFASSLSGFLAGIIVTSLVWLLIIEAYFK